MALTHTQQILEAITRSTEPLLCIPAGSGADGYASTLALAHALEKLEKHPTIVTADATIPEPVTFLPGIERVSLNLEQLERFTIELDASATRVDQLSYELKDDKLRIHLSPKGGRWEEKDVSLISQGFKYDLVLIVGAADLERLGHLSKTYRKFFFDTPIINIDHQAENEQFGQINLVDINACSASEVCHDLLSRLDDGLIDTTIATCLLAGMIGKTHSFKHPGVTPKTLQTAGRLIARGADRNHIVERLFRTRPISVLRLWGRALARLKADPSHPIVWSLLSQQDVLHAGSHEDHLPDVIDELIVSCPHAQIIFLLYETSTHSLCAILKTQGAHNALSLTAGLSREGSPQQVRIQFKKQNIVDAEQLLLRTVREHLAT